MPKVKINCPHCGQALQCDESVRARRIKCPHCREKFPAPKIARPVVKPVKERRQSAGRKKWLRVTLAVVLLVTVLVAAMLYIFRSQVHWPDRRPIGVLFLASDYHSSASNPRGWFNEKSLNITGTNGSETFRRALTEYTDRSLEILKRTGAQGVIVWDLEGEQFPHKTTFIGDPRLLNRLAPEMDAMADEFFQRLRDAGLRVGVTIRPQQLIFDNGGPRQTQVLNLAKILREKIAYARQRWGATLFYLDSNYSALRPDELWQLRRVAREFPDVLLIPEHHYPLYGSFSAPYISMQKGDDPTAWARWRRRFVPGSFQAVDISDCAADWVKITAAQSRGDILLFRAWTPTAEGDLLENMANEQQKAAHLDRR
jgi:hypothetical protein